MASVVRRKLQMGIKKLVNMPGRGTKGQTNKGAGGRENTRKASEAGESRSWVQLTGVD